MYVLSIAANDGLYFPSLSHPPTETLACTERQLVRTYPKGVRFDSSNYNPLPMWNCGMQMVALNYQSPGISQYTTVYHSIPQYTTIYHSIS